MQRRVINNLCMGDFICRHYDIPCYAVSHGGVDLVEKPPAIPEEPSAVFVGRLAEDTSLMLYLDALVALERKHGQRLRLVVAGDGPLRPIAERYVEAERLAVEFVGPVADPMTLLEEASFAFVSGYLAIWQALANRRLVFAVYENELKRDYVMGFPQAKDVLVTAGEAEQLAAALNDHLVNLDLGAERRERGALLAAENTWDRVADLYLAMYRDHGFE